MEKRISDLFAKMGPVSLNLDDLKHIENCLKQAEDVLRVEYEFGPYKPASLNELAGSELEQTREITIESKKAQLETCIYISVHKHYTFIICRKATLALLGIYIEVRDYLLSKQRLIKVRQSLSYTATGLFAFGSIVILASMSVKQLSNTIIGGVFVLAGIVLGVLNLIIGWLGHSVVLLVKEKGAPNWWESWGKQLALLVISGLIVLAVGITIARVTGSSSK